MRSFRAMNSSLHDTVTIITGAASGIGRACATLFHSLHGQLVLADRDEEGLHELVATLQDGSSVIPVVTDVTDPDSLQRMVDVSLERYGRIDHLVHSAGILRTMQELHTVATMPTEEWRQVIAVNLTGTFLTNQAVLPTMLKQRQGDIVNLSSVSGRQGRAYDAAYSASKFGIIGLSESLHAEVVAQGVRVQTLLPDAVQTPLWQQNPSTALPPSRTLSAERVAEAILYMITMPRDVYLLNPVISGIRSRRGGRGGGRVKE